MPARQRGLARIQSLERANAILEVLLKRGRAPLRDISAETGLNKTTAYYLVESLVELGLAERIGNGEGYCLGLRNVELGRAVNRRLDIVAVSRPSLIRLCDLTRETVNLAVPYVLDAMIVESLEGTHGVRATSYAGSRAPYHATACGKAILAHLDADVRKTIIELRPLTAVTNNTITSRQVLDRELVTIKARGYATDLEENELNANCVAVQIWDGLGGIAGAISVSGLANRLPPAVLGDLAKEIQRETRLIARSLGGEAQP